MPHKNPVDEQQCSPQQNAAEPQGSPQTTPQQGEWKKPHRDKRICGAEAKRRRKAREEAERVASAAHPSGRAPSLAQSKTKAGHSLGVPASTRDLNPPRRAGHPKGVPESKKVEHPQGVPPSKKRHRSGTSSEPTPKEHKRARQVPAPAAAPPPTSYKDATLSYLKVAIIDKDNPYGKIPKDKEILVKKSLRGELDKIILSTPGTSTMKPPMFRSWTYSGEIIRIVCEDDNTLGWLTKAVEDLRPWQNAALTVVRIDRLPRLTKATLWIPMEADSDHEDKEVVIGRLAGQNPTLSVRRWCLFHHEAKENPKGLLLVFGIGDEDIKTLGTRSMRIHYLFQSLALRVKTEKSTHEAEPGATPKRKETEAEEVEPSERIDATTPTPKDGDPSRMEVISPLTKEEEMAN